MTFQIDSCSSLISFKAIDDDIPKKIITLTSYKLAAEIKTVGILKNHNY